MNIKILHSWLLEYLDTNAKPSDIARCLSLCGPSIERLEKVGADYSYDIEITSNRVDSASVLGIAREAQAILPQFGFKTKLKSELRNKVPSSKLKSLLPITIDPKVVRRVMAVVLDVEFKETPKYIKERLEVAGMRSLNSIVDITNYVMLEIGHPTHAFDYDLIKDNKFVFRLSKKGEQITSFDGKTYKLPGDDIVIENGKGQIIDLPGIIGTKNSVVNKDTKRVLFFIDNNDPVKIRKTSMNLGIRTLAAVMNEKDVDPELAATAFLRGIDLYKKVCAAKVSDQIIDIYPKPYKTKTIKVSHEFIVKRLGINIESKRILSTLTNLGFKVKLLKDVYTVSVPSWRASDMDIPEDVVEEVARIYGYHNLPSELMTGKIPTNNPDNNFEVESKIKTILKSLGGIETYTLSLVSKEYADSKALRLTNPLGSDSEYLRTSLMPSLIEASKNNTSEKDPYLLFEMANVYIPRNSDLPEENMTLGLIFSNYDYRSAKGLVESLLSQLNISYSIETKEAMKFRPGSRIEFSSDSKYFAELGVLENDNYIYFESTIIKLSAVSSNTPTFNQIPKYPPQVEDITLVIPEKVGIGDLIKVMLQSSKLIANVELKDIYKDSHTFRVWYQDPTKTLDDKEVEILRSKALSEVKNKFGVTVK